MMNYAADVSSRFRPEVLEALVGRRRQKAAGPDMAPTAPPPMPPLPQPADGGGLGGALIRGAADVGAALIAGKAKGAPSSSPAAESARAHAPDFMSSRGAMTPPGTQFLEAPQVALGGGVTPKRTTPFLTPRLQVFGGGGTLRRRGDVAIVGDEGPELAIHDGKQTHVIPIEDRFKGLTAEALTRAGAGPTRPGDGPNYSAGPAGGAGITHEPRVLAPEGAGIAPQPAQPAQPPPADPNQPQPAMPTPARPDPVKELRDRINQEEANPAHDENGRTKSALIGAGIGALQGFGATGNWGGAVGGAAAGAGMGGFRPQTDEEFRQKARVAEMTGQMERALGRQKQELEVEAARTGIEHERAATEELRGRVGTKAADEERDALVRVFNDLPEFDPDAQDPETREMVERARRLRVTLPKKVRGDRFSIQVTPNGRVFKANTTTGEVAEQTDPKTGQSYDVSKQQPVKATDLPDTLFGIPDDKAIEDEARAAVADVVKSRRVRPEMVAIIERRRQDIDDANAAARAKDPNASQEPTDDASVISNMLEDGITGIWEDVTPRQERELAAARNRVRERYTGVRADADKFRLAVSRVKQKDGKPSKSLNQVIGLFNEYSAIKDAKKRRQMLDALNQSFDYYNVQ